MKTKQLLWLLLSVMLFAACEKSAHLPALTGLQGRQVGNSISLAWDHVDGAVGYKIYRNENFLGIAYSTTYMDNNPSNGFNSYKVVAFNEVSSSTAYIAVFFDENSSGENSGESGEGNNLTSIQQKLIGTTWDLTESVSNGTQYPCHARLFFKDENTIVFSNVYSELDANHIIVSGECPWTTNGNERIYINPWPTINNTNYSDAFVAGSCSAIFAGHYDIIYITDKEMKMYYNDSDDDYTQTRIYKKVSSGGGGGSSQGVTDLYLYDYTEWPTKIKVIYKYESDLPVTSAKIYYGEYSASSSISATVTSTTITATISGLNKNTVYYVKASATTSNGTVTSSESSLMTALE